MKRLISQSIVDNKNDFNLGTVNFVPFLTAANPQAMPDSNVHIPTSTVSPTSSTPSQSTSPTQNPTATPDQPDAQSGVLFGLDWDQVVIVVLGVVVVLLVVVILMKAQREKQL